jgi:hypothetical protein
MDSRLIFLHHARRSRGVFAGRMGVDPLDWIVPAMGEAVHDAEALGRTAKKSHYRTNGMPADESLPVVCLAPGEIAGLERDHPG